MYLHVKIKGRVQGVGYRRWAEKKAKDFLSISGWVRNRISGEVEIYAHGDKEEIECFLVLCRRGPLFAKVEKIEPVSKIETNLPEIQNGIFSIQSTV